MSDAIYPSDEEKEAVGAAMLKHAHARLRVHCRSYNQPDASAKKMVREVLETYSDLCEMLSKERASFEEKHQGGPKTPYGFFDSEPAEVLASAIAFWHHDDVDGLPHNSLAGSLLIAFFLSMSWVKQCSDLSGSVCDEELFMPLSPGLSRELISTFEFFAES